MPTHIITCVLAGGEGVPEIPEVPAETNIERLQRMLTEAQDALHKLATGTQIVDLWHDGRRRRYAQQNIGDLQSYIDWLSRQLEAALATACGRPRRRAIALRWSN